jgi:hypothetical protein
MWDEIVLFKFDPVNLNGRVLIGPLLNYSCLK